LQPFQFQYNWLLAALGLVPILVLLLLWALYKKRKISKKLGDPELIKKLTASYSPANFLFKFLLLTIGLSAIILAAANLQKPGKGDSLNRKGVDVLIALDVSKSMLAEDSKPNRLEKARQFVYKLMEALPDDRIGLVVFAGHAYLQMPLTSDHSAARLYVQNASPENVPTQGTVIGEALKTGNGAFNSKERKFKSIILITDGEDHDAEALQLAPSLASNGVMINSIGLGSPEGSTIIDPATDTYKKDKQGQPVISKLNEDLLQQLASATKGVYLRLDNVSDAVDKVSRQLDTIGSSSITDNSLKDYDTYYFWFIGVALLLIAIEFFWPERKWKMA